MIRTTLTAPTRVAPAAATAAMTADAELHDARLLVVVFTFQASSKTLA